MNVVSGFRVSDKIMARMPAVTKQLARDKKIALITNVTRSVAMRLAIHYGLSAMTSFPEEEMLEHIAYDVANGISLGTDNRHVSLSVPQWLLNSAQTIANLDTSGKTKRTHVLRCALDIGTGILERNQEGEE